MGTITIPHLNKQQPGGKASKMRVLSIFFWVTLLGSFGLSIANSDQPQQCSVTQNNNVLERAFGTVMVRKLASQTMKIEDKLDSMTTEMKNHVETQISGIKDQIATFQEVMKTQLETQEEQSLRNLEAQANIILEQMQAYFEEKCDRNVGTTSPTTPTTTTLSRRHEVQREMKAKLANFAGTEPEWVQDSLIWISNFDTSFYDAQWQCQSFGGRLYEPKSLEHNRMVWNVLKSKGLDVHSTWIGIHDIARRGERRSKYAYASSGRRISFQHWGSYSTTGQQPGNNNQDCIMYVSSRKPHWQGPSDAWDDYFCHVNHRFICEKPLRSESANALCSHTNPCW